MVPPGLPRHAYRWGKSVLSVNVSPPMSEGMASSSGTIFPNSRVDHALLKMVKLDIAALERPYRS
jgi:hypothetical protein